MTGERALSRSLCVVVHDVADATLPACDRLIAAVREVADVPLTLLAVPRYHHDEASPALAGWLTDRSRRGDEIALHGWTHLDEGPRRDLVDRLRRDHYTRSEGEFWALDAAEAEARLAAGAAWFAANGWPMHGFVAPAWLLGPGGWAALRGLPSLRYTSTLRHIHLLPGGERITSQSLVYSTSSAWRRRSSTLWARVVAASLERNPVLRVELHPRDADFADVRRSWQGRLERELSSREAMTVAQLTESWRGGTIGGGQPAGRALGTSS